MLGGGGGQAFPSSFETANNSTATNHDWEKIRLEARKLEVQINQQLQEISQIADALKQQQRRTTRYGNQGPLGGYAHGRKKSHNSHGRAHNAHSPYRDEESGLLQADSETTLFRDADLSLHQMEETVQKLIGHPVAEQSATSGAFAQRMREVCQSFWKEYHKLRREIQEQREIQELFEGGRSRGGRDEGVDPGTNSLLRERGSLEQSSALTDEILNHAMETHETLRRDRMGIGNATSQLTAAVGKIPGVQTLIKRIQSRQTRDNTIIGLVVAFCICFMLWYVMRKF